MAVLTVMLITVYVAGFSGEKQEILENIDSLNSVNSQKIHEMKLNPSPSPEVSQIEVEIR